MKLGEMAYQAQQEAGGDGDGPAAAQADGADDVVDADFEEVDDDDKKKHLRVARAAVVSVWVPSQQARSQGLGRALLYALRCSISARGE